MSKLTLRSFELKMQVEPSKESVMHTVRRFWTGKRFLKLFIFALLMGNITLYCVGILAKRQVITTAINHHNKVYTVYLQAVERATTEAAASTHSNVASPEHTAISPYWIALREVRRQFPYMKVNVVLSGQTDSDRDRKILEILRNRPRGWTVTDETEGWARTFYVLPTQNIAAFQAVSYVRDDLNAWETTAIMIGAYAFILLFAFGWFWTRALDDTSEGQATEASPELALKISELQTVMCEMESAFEAIHGAIDAAEKSAGTPTSDVLKTLDEMAAQVRILAVNGSIEAARSADTYRVFHVIMQEINHLAAQTRELLKSVDDGSAATQLRKIREQLDWMQAKRGTSGGGRAGGPHQGGGSSSRRVG